jgi:hypothetical protein
VLSASVPRSRQAVLRQLREQRCQQQSHATMATAAQSHHPPLTSSSDEHGPVQAFTYGNSRRVANDARGEPSSANWCFPTTATTAEDVRTAADAFAQERRRFEDWAEEIEADRGGNPDADPSTGIAFDSVWVEASLAKLRLAGPPRSTDGAGVFRALGAFYLMKRAIDVLVPATGRAVLLALLEEARVLSVHGLRLTSERRPETPAAVDDLAPTQRPAYLERDDDSVIITAEPRWWRRRGGGERLVG